VFPKRAFEKRDSAFLALVGQHLTAGQARGIIDTDGHVFSASVARSVTGIASDAVPSRGHPAELFDVRRYGVRKLTFAGSTEVGKLLIQQCAGTVKKLSLELGGNAPFIVFDDPDIEMAVKGAIASKYRNAGQACVCANRILVQDGVYDAFTKRLAETAGAMKVADGFEPAAVIGPLIDMKAVEKVEAHIADALKKGAKVVTGGKRAAQGGSFFEPTVLTDVTTDMVITKEETFGPVAPLYRFKTDAEAIKMANDAPTPNPPPPAGEG
jgi:acyl-CoA reductase-like NAD-dependent aldehyde dehydrogenase